MRLACDSSAWAWEDAVLSFLEALPADREGQGLESCIPHK